MRLPLLLCAVLLSTTAAQAARRPSSPISAPPAGWNSFVTYGDAVNEAQVLENARYMRDHLLPYGWNYIVIDYRWYDPHPSASKATKRANAKLAMDSYGRLMPAPNRFPSAADGRGFKSLADQLHAMGLNFGVHIMRGIPQQAVKANCPIEDSAFRAQDAADTTSTCSWCPDMYGVKGKLDAGQAWYDSEFRLFAAWGVDLVKVDDLLNPYSASEIKAIRHAIDRCGRPIIFSASPGPAPLFHKNEIRRNINMWRISKDFWDNWKSLNAQFDRLAHWSGKGGPGSWPDMDFLPVGLIGKKVGGKTRAERSTHFTREEQKTLISLWALAPSPMMLGANLPDNDDWTLGLLANPEVMAINQDPLSLPAKRLYSRNGREIWIRRLDENALAVGLFNRGDKEASISVTWKALGLPTPRPARDLWSHQDFPTTDTGLTATVPPHGAVLLRLSGPGN